MTTKAQSVKNPKGCTGSNTNRQDANTFEFLQKPSNNLSSVWKKSHSLHTGWKYCLSNCMLQRCHLDSDRPKITNSDGENLSNHYGKPFCTTEPIGAFFCLVSAEISTSGVSELNGKSNGETYWILL